MYISSSDKIKTKLFYRRIHGAQSCNKLPCFNRVTVSLYIKTMNGYCIENLSKFKYGFCFCRTWFLVRYLIKGKPSLALNFK